VHEVHCPSLINGCGFLWTHALHTGQALALLDSQFQIFFSIQAIHLLSIDNKTFASQKNVQTHIAIADVLLRQSTKPPSQFGTA
jgi:hypothetical protein